MIRGIYTSSLNRQKSWMQFVIAYRRGRKARGNFKSLVAGDENLGVIFSPPRAPEKFDVILSDPPLAQKN